jgi:hypothetical protein
MGVIRSAGKYENKAMARKLKGGEPRDRIELKAINGW